MHTKGYVILPGRPSRSSAVTEKGYIRVILFVLEMVTLGLPLLSWSCSVSSVLVVPGRCLVGQPVSRSDGRLAGRSAGWQVGQAGWQVGQAGRGCRPPHYYVCLLLLY